MDYFLVVISVDLPYPIDFSFRESASSFAVAVKRAIQEFRRDPKVKGRRVEELRIRVERYGSDKDSPAGAGLSF